MKSIDSSGSRSMKSLNLNLSKSIKSIKSLKSIQSLRSSLKNSLYLPVNSIMRTIDPSNNPEIHSEVEQLEGVIIVENFMEILTVIADYSH